jgi:hypothetical protein
MKFFTTAVFAASLLAISLTGVVNAEDASPKPMMHGDMSAMHGDPAAMCASMMQSMMNDPAMHQKMNEIMRRHMGGMSMSMTGNDPMGMYMSMMQTMMKNPTMHDRMNALMRQHMENGSMNMPMPTTAPHATPSSQ